MVMAGTKIPDIRTFSDVVVQNQNGTKIAFFEFWQNLTKFEKNLEKFGNKIQQKFYTMWLLNVLHLGQRPQVYLPKYENYNFVWYKY